MNKEIEIPDGYEARIEGNKVVLTPKESDDMRIRKEIINYILYKADGVSEEQERSWIAYLEKQKENPNRPILIEKAKSEKQVVLLTESNGDENIYWDTKSKEDAVSLLEKGLKFFGKQKEQKSKILIPKFQEGDVVISTKNNHLTYEILEIEHINELKNPEYKVEIFVDGKPDKPRNIKYIEIEKMDSWGELIQQKTTGCSKDERIKKAILGLTYLDGIEPILTKCSITARDIRTYLERQKEPENVNATTMISSCWTEKQKKQNGENEEDNDFTIYHPLKNGKGEYECIPYSFYGSLTSFSEDKDLISFLRTCFYTEEECNEWIKQQKEQKPIESSPKIPDWVHGGWDNEYMINTVIGRYSLHAEVAKKRGDTHDYNLSKSMENWLRNVVKPLILNEPKEQKPIEWSEEDSRKIGTLSAIIWDCAFHKDALDENNDLTGEYAELNDWLGSFPRRFDIQSKQEWSDDYSEENVHTRFAFYTYKDEPEVLYLSNVFVEESSRNNGLGTQILKVAEKVAETLGATSIRLKVKQNSRATKWYYKNGYNHIIYKGDYEWLEKNLAYMMKPNQEWREEDEDKMTFLEKLIEHNVPDDEYGFPGGRSVTKSEAISMLKSLHRQPHWKQLSEKDTLGRDKCYVAIRDSKLSDEEKRWAFNFLKRCEPKSHWKPSEEQMNYLCAVVDEAKRKHNISVSGYPPARILESLYNELKKL